MSGVMPELGAAANCAAAGLANAIAVDSVSARRNDEHFLERIRTFRPV
jgi:hypothetical protein